jgi:hypothetical protein
MDVSSPVRHDTSRVRYQLRSGPGQSEAEQKQRPLQLIAQRLLHLTPILRSVGAAVTALPVYSSQQQREEKGY